MIVAATTLAAAASSANTYLICLRGKAVFAHNKLLVRAFNLLWAVTTVCYFMAPFAVTTIRIGLTQRCADGEIQRYGVVGIVIAAAYDTLVFLAITYRLFMFHVTGGTWSTRMSTFFTGAGMGRVAKALLQTGQLYYLYDDVPTSFPNSGPI